MVICRLAIWRSFRAPGGSGGYVARCGPDGEGGGLIATSGEESDAHVAEGSRAMSDDARGPAAAPDPRSHGGMPEGAECGGSDDAALEAGRTQRALLAHVRHELRTPLNAIIGYSEMLIEDAADLGAEDWEESLRRILTSGQTLLAL